MATQLATTPYNIGKESKTFIDVTNEEAKKGRKVIYSPFFSFYLDYPCGMTPLKKTYNYKCNIGENAIMGLEAPLWTEYVDTANQLEFMTYPRIIALAERAWSTNIDYENFLDKLKTFLPYLKTQDINYDAKYNPKLIKRVLDTAKFFLNAFDHSLLIGIKEQKLTKVMIKKKYN